MMAKDLDPTSSTFNPQEALASDEFLIDVPKLDESKDCSNLNTLRDIVHSQKFNYKKDLQGVLGPGGLPVKKEKSNPTRRFFTAEQAPLPAKPRRKVRNVLTRMEEARGPLAVLKRCRDAKTRVKVYTRNHSEVRGILTGFVVAFDRHWNMVLKDCEEVYQKKLKNKSPFFGPDTMVEKVSDLSIVEAAKPIGNQSYWIQAHSVPQVWTNPFKQQRDGASSSLDNVPASSRLERTEDENLLQQRNTLVMSSCDKERNETPKKRRRKKTEIRHRLVKQILVRGESVVLVKVP